jgi:hypothetical protein
MAKRVHNETNPKSSRNSLIVMAVGGLLVAALVVWAVTRSVEPSIPDTSTAAGLSETTANATMPPADPLQATNTAANPSTNTSPGTMPPLSDLPQLVPPAPSAIPSHEDPDRANVVRIAAEDLRPKYNRGEVTVIDVRDAGSYAAGHITGAIHIPLASIEGEIPYLPKGKPIVTYCT